MTRRVFLSDLSFESLEGRLLLASDALASLADSNATLSSRPENLVHAGQHTYFDVRSDTPFPDCESDACGSTFSKREIFRTDGTRDGTTSLLGQPGRLDAYHTLGDRLVFVSGDTLYSSLGTPNTTTELVIASPWLRESNLIRVGQRVLWIGRDLLDGALDIFSTDGLTVEQFEPPFLNAQPELIGVLENEAWFIDGGVLWSITGTGVRSLRGTAPQIKNIGPAVEFDDDISNVDSLFFEAELVSGEGDEPTRGLWQLSKGRFSQPSTLQLVAPITGISDQVVVDSWIYFTAWSEETGRELRRMHTLSGMLELVFDASPGSASSNPEFLTEYNGKLLFSAAGKLFLHDPAAEEISQATEVLREFESDSTSFGPRWLTHWNNLVYFVADDGQGEELWSTDGTTDGTRLVVDIAPGPFSSSPNWLTPVGNELRFTANTPAYGVELWSIDQNGNANLIDDLRRETYQLGRFVSELTEFNDAVYFRLNDGVHGVELWRTDGTEAGTYLVKDIYPGPSGGSPRDLFVMGDWLYFTANDGRHGYELWRSDGTETGTTLVIDVWPGADHGAPTAFTEIEGELWFAANDGTAGEEIWKSNGTAEGTTLFVDVNPRNLVSSIGTIAAAGDQLYFSEYPNSFRNLWQHDGLRDPRLIEPIFFAHAVVNDYLFYASDGIKKTDGAPPIQVSSIREEQDADYFLAVFNGEMYYTGPRGVFRTKGESDGVLTALPENTDVASAIDAIAASERHLFGWNLLRANQRATIYSLNQQGEAALMLSDENKALLNVEPHASGLFFSVRDVSGAIEIWFSDGTLPGTRLLDSLETNGEPREFRRVGDTLLFVAEDGQSRETVWTVPMAVAGDLDGDYLITAEDVDALFAAVRAGTSEEQFDLNGDQEVNDTDVEFLVVEIVGTVLGDFNLDGRAGFADFLQLSTNFGGIEMGYAAGDGTGDRQINFDDFLLLSANFGLENS